MQWNTVLWNTTSPSCVSIVIFPPCQVNNGSDGLESCDICLFAAVSVWLHQCRSALAKAALFLNNFWLKSHLVPWHSWHSWSQRFWISLFSLLILHWALWRTARLPLKPSFHHSTVWAIMGAFSFCLDRVFVSDVLFLRDLQWSRLLVESST